MKVRSGGFFGNNGPSEPPSFSVAMAILLVVGSASVAALVLLALAVLLAAVR